MNMGTEKPVWTATCSAAVKNTGGNSAWHHPRLEITSYRALLFLDCDGVLLTDFNAGFATETFFHIHGHSLAVLKLINLNRTDIDTFAVANTFVVVNSNPITHFYPPK